MKKHTLIAVLAALFLCLAVFAACTDAPVGPTDTSAESGADSGTEAPADSGTDTSADSPADTDADTPAESGTTADTKADTEPVTAAPRYDYMAAEVAPDVTLDPSAYTDMKLTLPASLQITDADVADYIEYIRFDYRVADNGTAQMTDKPMKLGDDAFIYYKGVMDGEEFEGGSNWDAETPHQLGLGSGSFIPGFEAGLVGVIPKNATKETPAEIKVTFPENYGNELAGREATFYVAVVYAVQYTLPAYDRKFVEQTLQYEGEKDFYASDKAYLSEFEAYVRTYLEDQVAGDVENAKIDALWDHLYGQAECRNHPTLELDFYYNNFVAELEYYYDYYKTYGGEAFTKEFPTLDDFARSYAEVEEGGDWQAALREQSRKLVSKDMIAHAIAEREGLEIVTDEEYKAELAYWVSYYQGYMTEEDIIASMGETAIRESAFGEKLQSWLLDRAEFTFDTAE